MLPNLNNDNTNGQFEFDTVQQAYYTTTSGYQTSINQEASENQNPCHFPYTAPLNMGSNASVRKICQYKASYLTNSDRCKVCNDEITGRHYGIYSCDGCRAFFRRSLLKNCTYQCKFDGRCIMGINERKKCRCCRFNACLQAGMRRDMVKGKRMELNISQSNPQISSQSNLRPYKQSEPRSSTYTASSQSLNFPNVYATQNVGNQEMHLQNCQNVYPHLNYNFNNQPAGGQYELHNSDFITLNGTQNDNLENNSPPMARTQGHLFYQPSAFFIQPPYEYSNEYSSYPRSATNQVIPFMQNSNTFSTTQNETLPMYENNSAQYL